MTTNNITVKATEIRKAAYQGNCVAEGKQAAIIDFGHLVAGQMSDEEFSELMDHAAKASNHPARQSARDFGRSYLHTVKLLTAAI